MLATISSPSLLSLPLPPRRFFICSATTAGTPPHERTFSFAACPTSLPLSVASKAHTELADSAGADHLLRRKHNLAAALARAEAAMCQLMSIPANYAVLFLPGGAAAFRHALPLNLCPSTSDSAAYVITGASSEIAYLAAQPHCNASVAWTGQPYDFSRLPSPAELRYSAAAKYLHVTAEEPHQGLEFTHYPVPVGQDTVLVADMSSNFCSRPVNVAKFGVIYAGASGAGPAALTVAVVRQDLIGKAQPGTTAMLDFATHAGCAATICNSPSPAAIYLLALMFEDLIERGGLEAVRQRNEQKAAAVYDVIDGSGGFYQCRVAEREERSLMNAPFVLNRRDLERKFVAEAHLAGIADVGAHGGAVAGVVGAPPGLAGAERMAAFMREFQGRHQRLDVHE